MNTTSDSQTLPRNSMKKTLLLDLDETLIHSKTQLFDSARVQATVTFDKTQLLIYAAPRPGLVSFFKRMSEHYSIYIYTSSIIEYADTIIDALKLREYIIKVYDRRSCRVTVKGDFVKSISMLGFKSEETILVDDSLAHIQDQPENILIIKPYQGESTDTELAALAPFLIELASLKDVRSVASHHRKFVKSLSQSKSFGASSTIESSSKQLSKAQTSTSPLDNRAEEVIETEMGSGDLSERKTARKVIQTMEISNTLFDLIRHGSPTYRRSGATTSLKIPLQHTKTRVLEFLPVPALEQANTEQEASTDRFSEAIANSSTNSLPNMIPKSFRSIK